MTADITTLDALLEARFLGHQQPTHTTTRGSMTTFFVCWFVLACLALVINYLIHHNG
jgi:hypothetical protein